MKIALNKNLPLSLREQIKIQLKSGIDTGDLAPGQKILSARDLASMINVNRNTVTQAYKELAIEGFLETNAGSGTFVRKDLKHNPKEELKQIFDKAFDEAKLHGFSLEEINNYLFMLITQKNVDIASKTILVIDCNYEVINYLCESLKDRLKVKTEGMLIQDIEMNPNKAIDSIKGKDLIVCGFNHMEELRKIVPSNNTEVIPVLLRPDIKILNYLTKIPPGTCVGYVCVNQRSTETFYRSSFFSSGTELKRILIGLDSFKQNKLVLNKCAIIFATEFVYEYVKEIVTPTRQVVKINIEIEENFFEFVKEKLGSINQNMEYTAPSEVAPDDIEIG